MPRFLELRYDLDETRLIDYIFSKGCSRERVKIVLVRLICIEDKAA